MENCIFCRIAEGSISADIVAQDETFVAFRDIHPQAAVHVVIVPRKHWPDLLQMSGDPEGEAVAKALPKFVSDTARACGVDKTGFRLISNCGKDSGQSVLHVHVHLLGGESLGDRIR